jgi:hypothetical protein
MKWNVIKNNLGSETPVFGYGMCLARNDTLIIYGGLREPTPPENMKQRHFLTHNELWTINLSHEVPEFKLISWEIVGGGGGFNRIVSLGQEFVAVFGPLVGVKIIDINRMMSFEVHLIDMPEGIERTAFGIAPINDTSLVIFGGYNQAGGNLDILNSIYIFYEVNFYHDPYVLDGTVENLYLLLLLPVVAIIYGATKVYKKRIATLRKREIIAMLNKEMVNFNNLFEAIKNKKPDFLDDTMTLVLPNYYGLCVPVYKHAVEGPDFRPNKILAQGGFGVVYIGTLLNAKLVKQYNNGDVTCVIKKSLRAEVSDSFIQELSIHEVFKQVKYFAKLICFSTEPSSCIVLKYYHLGSLLSFLRHIILM